MSSSRPVFRSRWLPYLLVAPQLVITVIFFIWPAGEALWYSLQSVDPFGFSSQFVGLENFVALFHDSYYLDAFWTTIKFSALVTFSGLLVSLFFAALVDYVVRGSRFYQTLMLLPYAVAPAVAAVLWIFLFNPGRGLITHFLGEFGYDWNHAQNSGQAMFLVVFASVWKQISYNFYSSLPRCNPFPARWWKRRPLTAPGRFVVSSGFLCRLLRRSVSSCWWSTWCMPFSTPSR